VTASSDVALTIMAKAPRAGAVKTRLCPPLSPREAAGLARCLLRDAIAKARSLADVTTMIAYTPAGERAAFARLAADLALVPQRGHDLGERMRAALAEGLRTHRRAIVIGTDTPTLPTAALQLAIDRLGSDDVDVVLGPAEDGGYYLIGVRADHPTLFAGVPWSTPAVLDLTLRRAEAAGLHCALLPTWFDVDTADDLERLRAALIEDPGIAPSTSRFLARHDACRRRAPVARR
jgi:rSAM/selenodomain-associated transferase 1